MNEETKKKYERNLCVEIVKENIFSFVIRFYEPQKENERFLSAWMEGADLWWIFLETKKHKTRAFS